MADAGFMAVAALMRDAAPMVELEHARLMAEPVVMRAVAVTQHPGVELPLVADIAAVDVHLVVAEAEAALAAAVTWVAAAMAAADTGKIVTASPERPVCFGRRAFFGAPSRGALLRVQVPSQAGHSE
jgi:hypothetical protein